jgi:hypothetical protein
MPLVGGAPREVLENVQWADWSPDGSQLAVVRDVAGRNRLEYPIGKVLYETGGWISHPRISRHGDMIAFLDHAIQGDSIAGVSVVDVNGKKRSLTEPYGGGAIGLAWSPNGDEVWVTATDLGIDRALYAVSLSGKKRLVARVPADLTLQDVLSDGRALLARDNWRRGLIVHAAYDVSERDFTWLDWSYPVTLSADGRRFFSVRKARRAVELRRISAQNHGSPAVRLETDNRWRCRRTEMGSLQPRRQSTDLFLLPTGPGEPKHLEGHGIIHSAACYFRRNPDSVLRNRVNHGFGLCAGRRQAISHQSRNHRAVCHWTASYAAGS